MKPIKLTMQAFGSYAGREEIDFTRAHGFFLITGDTGAGKSTIFDAMMFALYGEISSAENEKKELTSQFANELKTRAMVELVFSQRRGGVEECYTVRRMPRYTRAAKRKGAKEQEESETVELFLPDGSAYPGKLTEINQKLAQIIGLTAAQFRQVVMIAQGEFMDFLRAKSDEKAELLRELLKTQQYRDLIDDLGEKQKTWKHERDRMHQLQGLHIATIQTEGLDDADALTLEEMKKRVWDGKTVRADLLPELMHQLDAQCTQMQEKTGEMAKQKQEAQQKRDDCLRQQEAANALLVRYQEWQDADKTLSDCAKQADEMQHKQNLIGQIRAAWSLHQLHAQFQTAQKELLDVQKGLEYQQQQKPALTQQVQQTEVDAKTAEQQFQLKSTEQTEVHAEVRKALDVLDALDGAKKALEDARKRVTNCAEAQAESQKAFAAFVEAEQAWQKELLTLQGVTAEKEVCQKNNDQWRQLNGDWKKILVHQEELRTQENRTQEKQKEYRTARDAYEADKAAYDRYRTAFLNAQAGLLAQELQEGQPCPVCGSTTHPVPCELPVEHRQLNQKTLDDYAQKMEASAKVQETASAAASAEKTRQSEKQAQLQQETEKLLVDMKAALPAENIATLDDVKLALSNWLDVLRKESQRVKTRMERLQTLQEQLKTAQETHQTLEKNDKDAQEALRQAENARSAAENAYAIHSAALKKGRFPDRGTAMQCQKTVEEATQRAQADKENAEMRRQQAQGKLHQCEALLKEYQQELPLRQQTMLDTHRAYQQALTEKQMTESAWQALCNQYQQKDPDSLQTEVNTFNQKKALATEKRKTAQEAIAGREKPDLARLQAEVEEAQTLCATLDAKLAQWKALHQNNMGALARLRENEKEFVQVCQKAQWAEHLYKVMDGQEKGNRVDLETFVQRRCMEQMLVSANRRFRAMSRGQFELRLMEMDAASVGRANRGLDLMVYSLETGKLRSVNTLSGGESFMAALALALGMSDQIQTTTSAICLDVMFIDEGFGSLDDQARREAVRVLQEIAGENKLIGIISHVSELKQEIDDQLIVTKTENGSHARWNA